MAKSRILLAVVLAVVLTWAFFAQPPWLQLCAGLAIFMFGMQCLDDGLRPLASTQLEQLLARSTGTPFRGLLFGTGATMVLQSSTLVSLLTVAFISSGLIPLASAIAIIYGANLGATSGIWLLAMMGQGVTLGPVALPLMVFGVLLTFMGPLGKSLGRGVIGVGLIFLGIDEIKEGFSAYGNGFSLTDVQADGMMATLLFVAVGLLGTVVLQSTHATLLITLAALATGQLTLDQSIGIAIGSNVGSSVSTAVMAALGGNRSGQRLAVLHVVFNTTTALLALLLLPVLVWLTHHLLDGVGLGENAMLKLALFHTLFNSLGVAIFWPWQKQIARALERWLPDRQDTRPAPGSPTAPPLADGQAQVRALHLSGLALQSADAATAAISRELRHLGMNSLDVISQSLGLPARHLDQATPQEDETQLAQRPSTSAQDADALYQRYIKGIYGDLLSFMGRLEVPLDESHQRFWVQSQMVAQTLVEAVKSAKHLQKNLLLQLRQPDSPMRDAYVALRRHLFSQLRALHALAHLGPETPAWDAGLEMLARREEQFEIAFRQRLFTMVHQGELDSAQTGSMMNDLGYASRIQQSLMSVARAVEEPQSLRKLRRLAGPDTMPDRMVDPA